MSPAFADGSLFVVDREYYRRHPVRPGDVVLLEHRGDVYLKRVLALPGDTVLMVRSFSDGGTEVIPEWQTEKMQRLLARPHWRKVWEMVAREVPADECFVLGDNTASSVDSRHFGTVSLKQIRGRVLLAPPPNEQFEQLAVRRSLRADARF